MTTRLCLLVSLLAGCAAPLQQRSVLRTSRIRVYAVGPCVPMEWPVEAAVSSGFGERDGRPHQGIDLAVGEGTPVRAVCDGQVAYAGSQLRGYGNLVILRHSGSLATVYAHNSRLMVQEGDGVRRGQVLALSGATGHVTAPHLHFEVRRDARPEDPLKYLRPKIEHRVFGRTLTQK